MKTSTKHDVFRLIVRWDPKASGTGKGARRGLHPHSDSFSLFQFNEKRCVVAVRMKQDHIEIKFSRVFSNIILQTFSLPILPLLENFIAAPLLKA